jgi:hypothetical protein
MYATTNTVRMMYGCLSAKFIILLFKLGKQVALVWYLALAFTLWTEPGHGHHAILDAGVGH